MGVTPVTRGSSSPTLTLNNLYPVWATEISVTPSAAYSPLRFSMLVLKPASLTPCLVHEQTASRRALADDHHRIVVVSGACARRQSISVTKVALAGVSLGQSIAPFLKCCAYPIVARTRVGRLVPRANWHPDPGTQYSQRTGQCIPMHVVLRAPEDRPRCPHCHSATCAWRRA